MDLELFISEVEKCPAILDPRDPKHCNRGLIAITVALALGVGQAKKGAGTMSHDGVCQEGTSQRAILASEKAIQIKR